jgi:adenylosuccinate synthase
MIHIVLGATFGDEGKGQCVHSLAHPGALVIRFSGGHQCGHTVVTKSGLRHIFSQFGAGTFRGAATYISRYCTVFPVAFLNEYRVLERSKNDLPAYYVHPLAMVTTPYDLAFNRVLSMITGHGTCGVGFGATLQRNEDFYNLYANDLYTPFVLDTKMAFIRKYYEEKVKQMDKNSQITYENELEVSLKIWEGSLAFYRSYIQVATLENLIPDYKDFIFEGSQGILLDQHFGFFPQVTRSNTTSQNAMEMIRNSALKRSEITTHYLSRCYQTRHGNGPFPGGEAVELIHTEWETNQENDWQGVFRTAQLDFSLIEHAVHCDKIYNPSGKKQLVITCLDQLKDREVFEQKLKDSRVLEFVDQIELKDCMDWE